MCIELTESHSLLLKGGNYNYKINYYSSEFLLTRHILQTCCMNGKVGLAIISHRANTAVCYSDREVLDIAHEKTDYSLISAFEKY